MNQKWIEPKKFVENSILIIRGLDIPLSTVDGTTRSDINKTKEELNTINQQDVTNICRKLRPKTAQFTFFSGAHGPYTKIDHVLNIKITGKSPNTWKL